MVPRLVAVPFSSRSPSSGGPGSAPRKPFSVVEHESGPGSGPPATEKEPYSCGGRDSSVKEGKDGCGLMRAVDAAPAVEVGRGIGQAPLGEQEAEKLREKISSLRGQLTDTNYQQLIEKHLPKGLHETNPQ